MSPMRPLVVGLASIAIAIVFALLTATGLSRDGFGVFLGIATVVLGAAFGVVALYNAWRLWRGEVPPAH